MLKRIAKILAWTIGLLVLLVLGLMVYVRAVSTIDPPVPESLDALNKEVVEVDTGLFKIDNNWFKKSAGADMDLVELCHA